MKIELTKYDMARIFNLPTEEAIKEIINIIYKYAIPFENKCHKLEQDLSYQVFLNVNRNRLLDLVCYRGLGFHYKQKKLTNNPEGYLEEIENKIKSVKITSALPTSNEEWKKV